MAQPTASTHDITHNNQPLNQSTHTHNPNPQPQNNPAAVIMVDNLTLFTSCGGLPSELIISNHPLMVSPERIRRVEMVAMLIKSELDMSSSLRNREIERKGKEGDGERQRGGEKEKEKERLGSLA